MFAWAHFGGPTLVKQIVDAVELHYGLPAALLLRQHWARHGCSSRGERRAARETVFPMPSGVE